MRYFVDFSSNANKELYQWGRETALRLLDKIKILETYPNKGETIGRSYSGKLFRQLRVGKFRVYYRVIEGVIEVEKIIPV